MAKTRRVKLRGGNQYGPDTEELMRRMQNILNGRLKLSQLNITSLPPLPSDLIDLDVFGTRITSLPELPPALEVLDVANTEITSLPSLPSNLIWLDVAVTRITSLPELPPNLRVLNVSSTSLTSLPELPPALEELVVSGAEITSLPKLPSNLKYLDVSWTPITSLPTLPPTLNNLDVSYTTFASLPELPSTLKYLNLEHSFLPRMRRDETIAQYNTRIHGPTRARDLSAAQQTVFRPGTAAPPGSALEKVMDANILNSKLTPMLTGKSEDYSNVQPEQKPVMQRLKKEVTGRYGGRTKKNKRI